MCEETNYCTECNSSVHREGWKGGVTSAIISFDTSLDLPVYLEIRWCNGFCDPLGFFSDYSESSYTDESGGSCKTADKWIPISAFKSPSNDLSLVTLVW